MKQVSPGIQLLGPHLLRRHIGYRTHLYMIVNVSGHYRSDPKHFVDSN
jgi:hypothetical protein